MPQISSALELLSPGETALVVFTDGQHLTDNQNGTGSTGWWIIDPERTVHRVIIYRRASNDHSDNDLFIARHGGIGERRADGRYSVELLDLSLAGQTTANWREFADTHQSPVRYISKPAKHLFSKLKSSITVERSGKQPFTRFTASCPLCSFFHAVDALGINKGAEAEFYAKDKVLSHFKDSHKEVIDFDA